MVCLKQKTRDLQSCIVDEGLCAPLREMPKLADYQ